MTFRPNVVQMLIISDARAIPTKNLTIGKRLGVNDKSG